MSTSNTALSFVNALNGSDRRSSTPVLKRFASGAHKLLTLLKQGGIWQAQHDQKLSALMNLLNQRHPSEKVLIFTQFADTVRYLTDQLQSLWSPDRRWSHRGI